MLTLPFNSLEDYEQSILRDLLLAIQADSVFFVSTDSTFKVLSSSGGDVFDYTYFLVKLYKVKKSRKGDFLAKQHKYCPYQYCANILRDIVDSYLPYYPDITISTRVECKTPNIIWL